jgi:hypothetical protein
LSSLLTLWKKLVKALGSKKYPPRVLAAVFTHKYYTQLVQCLSQ